MNKGGNISLRDGTVLCWEMVLQFPLEGLQTGKLKFINEGKSRSKGTKV